MSILILSCVLYVEFILNHSYFSCRSCFVELIVSYISLTKITINVEELYNINIQINDLLIL